MLDLHTHILPQMDDGSKSMAESLEMLALEKKHGVGRVALTPHFYAHRETLESFLERRGEAEQALRRHMAEGGEYPQVFVGAEVAFFNGMSRNEDIEECCLEGSQAMLIEMPFCKWTRPMWDELQYLRDVRGIQPVLAHVERYLRFQPMGTVNTLCENGYFIQANGNFFLRWKTRPLAMHLLKKGKIHFLGSDCHSIAHRPPNLNAAVAAIEKKLGREAIAALKAMAERI